MTVIIWSLVIAAIGFGMGAFIAGLHLVRAQERVNRKMEEELERLRRERETIKKEYEERIQEVNELYQKEREKREQLEKELKELQELVEEQNEQISRLKRELASKSQGIGRKHRPHRSALLD